MYSAHAFWHTYFLYGFPIDKPTYRYIYRYHMKSRLNSPVWGSLRLLNNRYIPPNTFTPVDKRFLNRIKYYLRP